ncbi:hypothetical protein [Neobacillus sp. DY30]|uniref:hypothetical protein n=1 Tax=Neobacillus sp. DY30 TaxID=3047871 RepID=UPI0024C0E518|nr:hypothetical protein [Neobacillus sp. DY30]WHY00914.1 hypothetical protein QNH29_01025 [Neobacillus sp. DY30]
MSNERSTLETLVPNLFNPLSPEFLANPYPFYHSLRSAGSIQWVSSLEHKGWFVTGYKEASAILKDSRFKTRVPVPPIKEAGSYFFDMEQHDAF